MERQKDDKEINDCNSGDGGRGRQVYAPILAQYPETMEMDGLLQPLFRNQKKTPYGKQ